MGDPDQSGPRPRAAAWLLLVTYVAFVATFSWRAWSNGNPFGAWIIAGVLIGLPAVAVATWLTRGPRDPNQTPTPAQRRRSVAVAYALAAALSALTITAAAHKHVLNDGIVLALALFGGAEVYRRTRR